jgi:ActR/RegA family two-component response regulator
VNTLYPTRGFLVTIFPQHVKSGMKQIKHPSEAAMVQLEAEYEQTCLEVYRDSTAQSWGTPAGELAPPGTALDGRLARTRKKIFLLEGDPNFQEELMRILKHAGDLAVCGTVSAVDQALPAIARAKPDLVLADMCLPGKGGLEWIKAFRSLEHPAKLLVVSTQNDALCAAQVLCSGGDGYVMKQEGPGEIVDAIHDVLEGRIYVSDKVMEGRRGSWRYRNLQRMDSPSGSSVRCRA